MKKSVTFGEYTSKIYEHLSCDIRFMYTGNIYGAMAEQFTARAHVYKSFTFYKYQQDRTLFRNKAGCVHKHLCIIQN